MGLKMSYEPEGEQIDEVLGGVPGDGYIGHPNLDIKNPFAKTQKKEKVLPKAAPGSGGPINRLAAQLGDKNPQLNSYEPEGETIDELNRYEKETGKDYKTGKSVTKGGTMGGDDSNSKVMRHMQKVMGAGRMGAAGPIQKRGEKKEPGKKPPEAGKYGSERRSPEQIVRNNRAVRKQGQENMSSRFD